jgi:hypothetical protein
MPKISLAVAVIAALAAGQVVPTAFAADIPADSLKLAPGVVKAEGYETPATTYIVANSTNIYSDHSLVGDKVTGELKRGDRVEVLAKVKGWEWVLVGKDGTGIGYVSISMLSPADKYVPRADSGEGASPHAFPLGRQREPQLDEDAIKTVGDEADTPEQAVLHTATRDRLARKLVGIGAALLLDRSQRMYQRVICPSPHDCRISDVF